MSLWDSLFGKKHSAKNVQLPTMGPEQMNLLNSILGQLGGPMGQGISNLSQILSGSPEALEAFQAPAMRQFKEQTVPGLAEQFAGYDALGSSGFGQQMGAAGAGLAENLAAMKANLQQNAMGQLSNLFGMGMGVQPFQNMYTPESRSQGFLGSMLPGLAGGLSSGAGMGMGAGIFSKLFNPKT